jgi:hypothetical protein
MIELKRPFGGEKKKRNKVDTTKIQAIDRKTNGLRREVKQ